MNLVGLKIIGIIQIIVFLGAITASSTSFAIYGGRPANISNHPWQVKIFGCGAVIISQRFLLTAAHCVENVSLQDIKPKAGAENFSSNSQSLPKVKSVFIHPRYQGWEGYPKKVKEADIALIELVSDIQFSESIQMAHLPKDSFEIDALIEARDQGFFITGWGDNGEMFGGFTFSELSGIKILQRASELSSVEDAMDIENQVNRSHSAFDNWVTFLTGDYLMIEAEHGQACQGDSGGPLVHLPTKTLYGISAHTLFEDCGDSSHYFYSDVSKFLPWIKKTILNHGDSPLG